MNFSVLDMTY